MTACGLTRWHPYLRAAAPSRSCVLESGHEGMCRDGWGSSFEGTKPRPRALSPGEVDEYNRANDAEDAQVYGPEDSESADARLYGLGLFEARQEDAATDFVVVPVPDMLPEEVDGVPVMHSVYGLDTSVLGTLSADDAAERWLPTTPDGVHGPLCASVTAGAEWLAEVAAGTPSGPVYGFRALETAAASRYGSGTFGGRDAQAYAFRGSETADTRLYGLGLFDVAPCPAHGCALLAGHGGKHMDLDAREWAGTKGLDMTTEEAQTTNGTVLPAEAMADQVSRLLATPGLPARSVATLRRADGAFNLLDGLMRSGAPVPGRWRVTEDAEDDAAEYVTRVYDALSESLREHGEFFECFAELRMACSLWRKLDTRLREGAPLPEPWRR